MDRSLDVIQAIINQIETDIPSLTNKVWTRIPDKEVFPYIKLEINSTSARTFTSHEQQYTLVLRVLSNSMSIEDCLSIRADLIDSLDRSRLLLNSGHTVLVLINEINSFLEPDYKVWQAFSSFTVNIIDSP